MSREQINKSMKVRVSSVSFFNSAPFIHGLTHSNIRSSIELSMDNPAECARKLQCGEIDLGLIPIAIIPRIKGSQIISNYCIGSMGHVQTVALLSSSPLGKVDTIILDNQSRTSNSLAQILARELWKKEFQWEYADIMQRANSLKANEGLLAIGDKVFEINGQFEHNIDLATEWVKFSQLPFVFATWTANKPLPQGFIEEFNGSLQLGLSNLPLIAQDYAPSCYSPEQALNYLTNSISYDLTEDKRRAMEFFWKLAEGVGSSLP